MRHLTVDVVSNDPEDPETFNIDVNPKMNIGELRDIITSHYKELFLFSKLGQIECISHRGRALPWTMLVAGLNKIDSVQVHVKEEGDATDGEWSPQKEKHKAVVISYDQPKVFGSQPTPGASISPEVTGDNVPARDSSSPCMLEKVKSLDVEDKTFEITEAKPKIEYDTKDKKRTVSDVGYDHAPSTRQLNSTSYKIMKLNRIKVHRGFFLGSPILFFREGSTRSVSSVPETPLGLYLDPAFDAKERQEIKRRRGLL